MVAALPTRGQTWKAALAAQPELLPLPTRMIMLMGLMFAHLYVARGHRGVHDACDAGLDRLPKPAPQGQRHLPQRAVRIRFLEFLRSFPAQSRSTHRPKILKLLVPTASPFH
jgi:hypothetical protein